MKKMDVQNIRFYINRWLSESNNNTITKLAKGAGTSRQTIHSILSDDNYDPKLSLVLNILEKVNAEVLIALKE